jgi:hypothetical protein
LVADIHAEPASVIKDSVAFAPYQIEIIDIIFVAVIKPDLVICPIILELPVRGRSNYQMD